MPLLSRHPGDLDVAVVGGGAAGIGAARALAAAGLSVLLLEAGPRLGGRARTEHHGTGPTRFPLDLGCGWLHSANHNAWAAIAADAGIPIDRTASPWERQSCNHGLSSADQGDFGKAFAAYDRRIEEADLDRDRTAADFLDPGCRWNPLLDAVSTWFNGVELRDMSALDYRNFDDTEKNWRIPTGYGALVAGYGAPITAMVNTPVREIDHRGTALRIVTDRGTSTARAVIIAVPTSVIATEVLRFTPVLPGKIEAAGSLPLGTVNKVFLACHTPEMFPKDGHLFGNPAKVATGSYHLRPFGRPLIEGFIAGRLAKDLAAQGEAAATAVFAIEELVASLGSDFRRHVAPLAASAWEGERFIGGAYSHAAVGCVPARARLAAAVDDRLFFAGEACSTTAYSTAHGALDTGRAAAKAVIAALRKPRPVGPHGAATEQTASAHRSQSTGRPRKGPRIHAEEEMPKYSKSAGKDVESAVDRQKKGKLKSGKGGKGGTVKSRKQAIAIGLSEARAKGKKVPKKKAAKKTANKKTAKKKAKKKARKK